AGERGQAETVLAGYALEVVEQAAAALATGTYEQAGARWLDAEDAITRQALAWAMDHDPAMAVRLAVALAPWWLLRRRSGDGYPLLSEGPQHATPGRRAWCAAPIWRGPTAIST